MNRPIYSSLLYLVLPFVFMRLLWRSLRIPAYRQRWYERLAYYDPDQKPRSGSPRLLFHAVSVGEVHAAIPLIEMQLAQMPTGAVLITTMTPGGSRRVRDIFGTRVDHVYLPWDLPGAMSRLLHWWQPDLLVLLETELWPNLIHACAVNQVNVMLVNARLSIKSLRGYARFPGFSAEMVKGLQSVCVQSPADADRLVQLGLPEDHLSVTGSLKFDQAVDKEMVDEGRLMKQRLFVNRPVLAATSTREGEEALVLEAFHSMLTDCPELVLILVPRHPERCDQVYRQCLAAGFNTLRRSEDTGNPGDDRLQILLGDSMGEMWRYYGSADIAFVGGSLVNTGCQNILEPAALGIPVITGPSLFNFQSVADKLMAAGALQVVNKPAALAQTVVELISDPQRRLAMSHAGREVVSANQGAVGRIHAEIRRHLGIRA